MLNMEEERIFNKSVTLPEQRSSLSTSADLVESHANPGDPSRNRVAVQRRLLQQRAHGFVIDTKESLIVMEQSLKTMNCLQQMHSELNTDHVPHSIPKAFDLKKRILTVGMWVDVKDTTDNWVNSG
jgi:hypothetical protein